MLKMRARREKGICCNCDEVFKPGHNCKSHQLFMLAGDEVQEE